MRAEQKGMTSFYNDFHDPESRRRDVGRCRDIQVSLNEAVLEAYGLDEIDLELGFHKVGHLPQDKNTRFTMSEKARQEILNRLSETNKSRYLEQEKRNASPRNTNSAGGRKHQRNIDRVDQAEFALAVCRTRVCVVW